MPFGEEIYAGVGQRTTTLKYSSSGVDNVRQRYTGYQKDAETELDFAEARMYQNKHGRFTAPDPLMSSASPLDPQTFNRYTYTGNNPVNATDPSGLDWCQSNNSDIRFAGENVQCKSGESNVTGQSGNIKVCGPECVKNGRQVGDNVRMLANGQLELITPAPANNDNKRLEQAAETLKAARKIISDYAAKAANAAAKAGQTVAEDTGLRGALHSVGVDLPDAQPNDVGEFIGHADSTIMGAAEFIGGGTLIAGGGTGELFGFVADSSGGGAVLGIPLNIASTATIVVGAALSAHGTYTINNGITGLYNQMSGIEENTSGSRPKQTEPVSDADGPHTTIKKDGDGNITGTETWNPNPKRPGGWDSKKRVDLNPNGAPHRGIPTPHTQGKKIPGGVRPARKWEIP